MSFRPLILFLVAGAVVLVGGPRASHNETAASTNDQRPLPPILNKPNGATIVAKADVSVKNGVELALHITNTANHAIEINFPSGETHDFAVLDSAGREVWRWSNGRMFTQSVRNKLLGAGETLTFEEKWEGAPREAGHYTVVAKLTSSNHPVEQRVEFALP